MTENSNSIGGFLSTLAGYTHASHLAHTSEQNTTRVLKAHNQAAKELELRHAALLDQETLADRVGNGWNSGKNFVDITSATVLTKAAFSVEDPRLKMLLLAAAALDVSRLFGRVTDASGSFFSKIAPEKPASQLTSAWHRITQATSDVTNGLLTPLAAITCISGSPAGLAGVVSSVVTNMQMFNTASQIASSKTRTDMQNQKDQLACKESLLAHQMKTHTDGLRKTTDNYMQAFSVMSQVVRSMAENQKAVASAA